MRDVVLSIRPRWAELIYSSRKTVEWCHTYPEGAGTVFLYECDLVRRIGVTGIMHIGDIREVDARSVPKDLLVHRWEREEPAKRTVVWHG